MVTAHMEKSNYIGYIWYSDSNEPVVYDGKEIVDIDLDVAKNRFIIEGQLYSSELSKSVSIKYIDGMYIERVFDITDEDLENATLYESNRIDDKTLKFTQRWVEKTDDYCNGMPVLVPAEIVFVGFEN